jgi:hypothetical protein
LIELQTIYIQELYPKLGNLLKPYLVGLFEKSDIQKASKVKSTKGLNLHIYGRLAAAFITLLFNS